MHVQPPVGLTVTDDLHRSRLTVLFRLILAIPHILWVVVWSVGTFVAAIGGWVVTLITGELPGGLHRFFCAYIRYVTHVFSYLYLVTDPYPAFNGRPIDGYPVDVTLPDPVPQRRVLVLVRIAVAIPALLLSAALTGGGGSFAFSRRPNGSRSAGGNVTGMAALAAVLGWFACIVHGKMPRGLRDTGAYGLGYRAQALAYVLLVTERYPNSDPHLLLSGLEPPPLHPVRLEGDALDLRRSRVTVFFRLPLLIPHLVWLGLWGVLAGLTLILQWFVTLFAGRPAAAFHRFLSAYVRYAFHVYAFGSLAANPFPGFTGRAGAYPLDLVLPEPGRQNRWKTLFPGDPGRPGLPPHRRALGRPDRRSIPHLVHRALHGPRTRGSTQRRRLGASLLRPDERVPQSPHRRLPALEPARRCEPGSGARRRAGARAGGVSRTLDEGS